MSALKKDFLQQEIAFLEFYEYAKHYACVERSKRNKASCG